MTVRFSVFAMRACAVFAAALLSVPVAVRADKGDAGKSALVQTANPAFYVVVDTSDKSTGSAVAIAVAGELNKYFRPPDPPGSLMWAIPEPNWGIDALTKQCEDPNAVGGVVLTYYLGDATHFWILWQTDTTTFSVFAQFVSCHGGAVNQPETVAIVSQLHGSGDRLWTERRSQTSTPLLSFAAVIALLGRKYSSKSSGSSVNSSIALASVGAAVVGQGLNKDIPGYSQPLRIRYGSAHIGDDLVRELSYLCGFPRPDDLAAKDHPLPPTAPNRLGDVCAHAGLTRPQ